MVKNWSAKNTGLVVLMLFINGVPASLSASYAKKFTDFLAGNFGTEKLSTEHESQVRSIMTQMGITKAIDMRYMNYKGLQTFGLYNAIAYLDSYLFFSKYFFTKLTFEEQLFLIGHELTHIKQNHTRKIALLAGATGMLAAISALGMWQLLKRKNFNTAASMISSVATYTFFARLTVIPCAAYMRSCEKEADKQSACVLKCPQSGVKFLQHMNELNAALGVSTSLPWSTWWKRLTVTHPSDQERINLLNNY